MVQRLQGTASNIRGALEQAIDLEPANPETWRRLGPAAADALNDPKGALRAFQAAYYLDPQSPRAWPTSSRRRAWPRRSA